jgi:hypothetical protein
MGSGTTAIIARQLGGRLVGIELKRDTSKADRRLEDPQVTLAASVRCSPLL